VAISTDFIGPIPVDDYVLGYWSPTSDDNLKVQPTNWQWFGTSSGGILGLSNTTGAPVAAYTGPAPLENDLGRFVVEWRHANGTIQESLSVPAKWTTSQLAQYGDLIGWGTAGGTGGFTATDRAEAATTQANTEVALPVLGGIGTFVSSLADWATLSHGTITTRGAVILLQGRGSLVLSDYDAQGVPTAATSRGLPCRLSSGSMTGSHRTTPRCSSSTRPFTPTSVATCTGLICNGFTKTATSAIGS